MLSDPHVNQMLLEIKEKIVPNFTVSNWQDVGLLTNCPEIVNDHPRLLRSLSFGDEDYEACVVVVLRSIMNRDLENLNRIDAYLQKKFVQDGEYVSSMPSERRILFAPNVFKIPDEPRQSDLVAVMMPFAGFDAVHEAIKNACKKAGFKCVRADGTDREKSTSFDRLTGAGLCA